MVRKILVSLACCALIAPLAFAESKEKKQKASATATVEQGVTVTGTIVSKVEEATATNYQPARTLIVRNDRSNDTSTYVLNGRGHVLNRKGEIIHTAIKPGAHVRVYFASANGVQTIDHVVVD